MSAKCIYPYYLSRINELDDAQLRMEVMEGQIFEGWREGSIKFGPTYKYYPHSDQYYGNGGRVEEFTKAQKKRAPAW